MPPLTCATGPAGPGGEAAGAAEWPAEGADAGADAALAAEARRLGLAAGELAGDGAAVTRWPPHWRRWLPLD
jgi:hypothetical protein